MDGLAARGEARLPGSIVVLNTCKSALPSPVLADSFVYFFLSRGASAVIGTECPHDHRIRPHWPSAC